MDTQDRIITGPVKRDPKLTVYPVAEIFTSPQGEGLATGTLMTFVRLAGCTVGKPYPKSAYTDKSHPAYGLPMYMEECHTLDGRSFPCDTNFKVKERLTAGEIIGMVPPGVERLCITGGEPLIHELRPLIINAFAKDKKVHIETSGTIPFGHALPGHRQDELWITCSPKLGALPDVLKRSNEIKLLVDENFDPSKLPDEIINHPLVWVQPINFERSINAENLVRVINLQKQFPRWRISLQLHKVLEHFTHLRIL